jgi:NB-ARC domain
VQQAQTGRDLYAAKELHIHSARDGLFSPRHQLPPAPAMFTGRERELEDLETALAAQGNIGVAISAFGAGIQGMGGVGKTALATVLAHRLKRVYPDAQVCLNLRGFAVQKNIMSPVKAMQRIIHVFRPDANLPESMEDLRPLYISVLTEAGRVLLFLDNAADVEQIEPLLPPPNCLLLVTSRNQFSLPGLATRNIDCLPPTESQKLLLRLAPRLAGHEAAAADLCGHLPLALEIFAGVVSKKTLHPVEELVARLRKQEEKLGQVEAAFQLSYDLLEEGFRRCWRLSAVFQAGFDLPAAAAIWEMRMETSRDAMEVLLKGSLVATDEAKSRFRLHELVRKFCIVQMSEAERDAAMMRHNKYFEMVGGQVQKEVPPGRQGAEAIDWFSATVSTKIVKSRDPDWPMSADSLERLCRVYWNPICAYISKQRRDGEHTKELTQKFFVRWLEQNCLAEEQVGNSTFRNFLINALKEFVAAERGGPTYKQRGDKAQLLPGENLESEELDGLERGDAPSLERLFERHYALTLLEQARSQLGQEYTKPAKAAQYDRLKHYITRGPDAAQCALEAETLGVSETVVRSAVYEMQRRFHELVRLKVAETVAQPENVDNEIRYLMRVLA